MTRQPNIVFILIDDMGWRDLGCYGSTFYETPNIDALASQGALFTDAYAAAPVCSPTRASLMSGKYPARVGVTQYIGGLGVGELLDVPFMSYLSNAECALPRALRDGGYQTWHVGKWHLGDRRTWPDQHGFDANIGGCGWGQPKTYWSPYDCPTLEDGPDGEYLTDRLTDEAIALVENAGDRPFFLNLWHYAVHIPMEVPADLVAKYEAKAAALGVDDVDAFEDGEPFPVWHKRTGRVQRRTVQSDPRYAAMVENLDTNVGRLLDALERTGHADDTLVVFTSDNGGLSTAEGSVTCNLPLAEGKGWTDEGGIREPLIVRWPGVVAPGTRIAEPVTSPDLYPTLLAAAGLPARPEQHVDGVDITAVLTGGSLTRGPIYWHYPHYSNQGGSPSSAMRDGRYKLVHYFADGHRELYDLEDDIGETHDLAAEQPDRVQAMAAQLDAWVTEVGGQIPRRNPYPEAWPDLYSDWLHNGPVRPGTSRVDPPEV